jgi:hypothetical protein
MVLALRVGGATLASGTQHSFGHFDYRGVILFGRPPPSVDGRRHGPHSPECLLDLVANGLVVLVVLGVEQ